MSLFSEETLAQQYWKHECTAKEGAVVYTQHGEVCYLCSKTEQQVTEETPPAE